MTEELKPCPFCGGAPTEHAIEPHTHAMMLGDFKMPDHEGAHVIECACGAGFVDDTREAVVTRWNTRALTAAQPAQTDSMGMPTSCGKPLCLPDEHHPLCTLHKPAQAAHVPEGSVVECRECAVCNHVGINDARSDQAVCSHCGWYGATPSEDQCPSCGDKGTMSAACPKCSGHYRLLASAMLTAAQQGATHG